MKVRSLLEIVGGHRLHLNVHLYSGGTRTEERATF
jgi:hypothetical protein